MKNLVQAALAIAVLATLAGCAGYGQGGDYGQGYGNMPALGPTFGGGFGENGFGGGGDGDGDGD